jgi:hypothetical protein
MELGEELKPVLVREVYGGGVYKIIDKLYFRDHDGQQFSNALKHIIDSCPIGGYTELEVYKLLAPLEVFSMHGNHVFNHSKVCINPIVVYQLHRKPYHVALRVAQITDDGIFDWGIDVGGSGWGISRPCSIQSLVDKSVNDAIVGGTNYLLYRIGNEDPSFPKDLINGIVSIASKYGEVNGCTKAKSKVELTGHLELF